MIATIRMIGFSGHVEISQDSVPLIGKALRDKLGTMHGPFVGITMMGPGADQVFARSVLETGGHLYVVMPTLGFQYRDEFEDPGARAVYDQFFARATYAERVANYRWSTIESTWLVVKRWSTPAMCSTRCGMESLASSLVMSSSTHVTSGSRSSGSGHKVPHESCRHTSAGPLSLLGSNQGPSPPILAMRPRSPMRARTAAKPRVIGRWPGGPLHPAVLALSPKALPFALGCR
jgi:hypothetical protein